MPQKQPNRPGATKRPPPPAKPPDGCATANPIRQPIHVDTLYDYRLMLADGRPVLGVIGGGHAQPFTAQEKVEIAAHAVACWNAVAGNTELRERVKVLEDAIALAYGHLWCINDEPGTPSPLRSPMDAAYSARKILRGLLTTEQRGDGINAARKATP